MTRSQDNVIYEIDGKPASEVLKEYLPQDALTDERDWMRHAAPQPVGRSARAHAATSHP